MKHESWISAELAALDARAARRALLTRPAAGGVLEIDGRRVLNFASNDYLDLLRHPDLARAAAETTAAYGTGSGASRLVTGNLPPHEQLERDLARHKGTPAALLFGAGFLANLGAVTALVGRGDTVFADRLVHASLVDAIRLSRATLRRFRHNDPDHLATALRQSAGQPGRRLVITESVFSMDGDLAPLPEIVAAAESHGALILVDDAHATGVFGPHGAGLIAAHHLTDRVNLGMGTLSKGLGGFGGFVTCSEPMKDWLINTARAVIYTTALPPAICAAGSAALALLEREPERGATLLRRAERFRSALQACGFDTGASASPIIPIKIGDNASALALADRVRAQDLMAVAIRPPTVPPGTARLRLSVTLAHTDDDLDHAAHLLATAARELHLLP